jgi:hypothetical protein
MSMTPLTRWLLVLTTVLAVASCSAVRVAYLGADFFLRQYAEDYLNLDADLLADWRPQLAEALARHRAEELPYLARFFDTALRGAEQGLDRARVECLHGQALVIYQRHARLAVDLAAPLLAASGPEQLRALEARLREDWEDETSSDPKAVARRERKRAERYADATQWWLGGLTPRQEALIQAATAAMPDTAAAWSTYRRTRQEGLLHLLRRGGREDEIRAYLTAWLVDHRDLPPSLDEARHKLRDAVVDLVVRLDQSLSPEQEAQFQRRLRGLRDDFLALQPRPRLAVANCD